MEKISVIVPIYNVAKYLRECIESIIVQTYKKLEIILVNDGSTDESGEICNFYARQDKRIIVIHKKNGGLVSARKVGLEVASGEYIGFVDGDDYIAPSFYEVLLNGIIQSNADFVHTGYIVQTDRANYQEIPFKEQIISNDFDVKVKLIKDSILKYNNEMRISPSIWSKIFRKEFIQKYYNDIPNELSQGEDTICLALCLIHANKILLKQVALYFYRRREGSLTDYKSVRNIEEIWRQYAELKKIFIKNNIYQYLEKDLDENYLKFTINIINKLKVLPAPITMYQFDDVNMIKGKKVIIYGAGAVGQNYYAQISKYKSCEIVAWVDKNYEKYSFDFIDIKSSECIKEFAYDYIIIAVKSKNVAANIINDLVNNSIEEDKIIWREPKIFLEN